MRAQAPLHRPPATQLSTGAAADANSTCQLPGSSKAKEARGRGAARAAAGHHHHRAPAPASPAPRTTTTPRPPHARVGPTLAVPYACSE